MERSCLMISLVIMRSLFVTISILFFYQHVNARSIADTLPGQDQTYETMGCRIVETDAGVNSNKWAHYLSENIVLDSVSLDSIPAGIYKFFVQFVIDKDGSIMEAKVKNDPGYGIGRKAAEVILQSKGLWKPAERNGRYVKSYRMQPITFIIEEEEEETTCKEYLPTNLIL